MTQATICVIIAARNAADTIGRAVASALAQPEVAEVLVVDDASTDATGAAAGAVSDGSGRLRVIRLAENGGPSVARNRAIAESQAPLIAILDADDFLLPGRFAAIAGSDLDLAADNMVFVSPERAETISPADLPAFPAGFRPVDATGFVLGNISSGKVRRGELGFLKPVMARAFLDRHGLRYDESMWLGEDYDLYVQMLLRGARFGLTRHVGYVAVERGGSLSGRHRTADLVALEAACRRHAATPGLAPDLRAAIAAHLRQVTGKRLLREFLDTKRAAGFGGALAYALSPPSRFLPIARGVARDKLAALRPAPAAPETDRLLLTE